MNLLKKNYGLTLWLVRIAYIAASIFGKWPENTSTVVILGEQYGLDINVYGSVWAVVLYGLLSAALMLVIITWFAGWIFRYARIYNLPVKEITLFVVLFAALKNLIGGLLKLTYLISPLFIGWGKILYDFIGMVIAVILFYRFVDKKYLPDGNKAYFFRTVFSTASIFFVLQVILGVFY